MIGRRNSEGFVKQDGPKAEKRVRQVIRRMALEAIGVEKEPDTPGEEMN